MAKDEILALPLDKLNELVAEKVMGECLHQHWDDKNQDHIECLKCGQSRFYHQESQDFHRDIQAAWRVQEKMAEKGYIMALINSAGWCCAFGPKGQPVFNSEVFIMESAPEAICRAALLAIEK